MAKDQSVLFAVDYRGVPVDLAVVGDAARDAMRSTYLEFAFDDWPKAPGFYLWQGRICPASPEPTWCGGW